MGKASLKRWVLREALNTARVGAVLMCCGSGFQRVGADTEKALSPQVTCNEGTGGGVAGGGVSMLIQI